MNTSEQLCLACGLCCDGTLFDNVRLTPSDDAAHLKQLGHPIKLSRSRTPITYFPQPCAALCSDRTCRLYAHRPAQCRAFECQVFKNHEAGQLPFASALRLVKQTRRKAENLRQLLRQLGDTDEHRSLPERFRRTQRRLESECIDAATAATYADLSQAMHHFTLLAHEKFHTKAESFPPEVNSSKGAQNPHTNRP